MQKRTWTFTNHCKPIASTLHFEAEKKLEKIYWDYEQAFSLLGEHWGDGKPKTSALS
jgi:hypothetical protein